MVNYYKSRVNTVCFPEFALGNHIFLGMGSETHSNRQATQHGCLPSLLGDWDKEIVKVYGEEKNILYRVVRAAKTEQKSLVSTRQAQRTNQERTPFICYL
jgi:hypothetical protein